MTHYPVENELRVEYIGGAEAQQRVMPRPIRKLTQATTRLRVKSGRAIAVGFTRSRRFPHVFDSYIVQLSNSKIPETTQPYHARMGRLEEDQRTIQRRVRIIEGSPRNPSVSCSSPTGPRVSPYGEQPLWWAVLSTPIGLRTNIFEHTHSKESCSEPFSKSN